MTQGNNLTSRNSSKLEEILGKYMEESCKRKGMFDEGMERFRENTDKNLRRHDCAIKVLKENVTRLVQAIKTHDKLNRDKTLDIKSGIIISLPSDNSNLVHGKNFIGKEIVKKIGEEDGLPRKTLAKEPGNFR
ncbi:hypothetical protein Tco_0935539 [Tanacetum coccineum]